MKIGIITYPLNNNYGNLLQAYALMSYLKKGGCDVELIDKRVYKISTLNRFKKSIKLIIAYLFKDLLFKKYSYFYINLGFSSYIRKNIKPKTKTIYDENQLNNIVRKGNYDLIIVGSDQVWRKEYMKNNIQLYFLSFVPDNIKKISYSASFGVDYWQFDKNETDKLKKYLSTFNGISVREDSAVGLIKDNIGINAKHIIDPTLLLNVDDYLNLSFKKKNKIEQKYLFCYILDDDDEKMKIIDFVSDSLKINSRMEFSLNGIKKNNMQIMPNNPIENWLLQMYHSEFVVTDSFHGVVFSILFNKPFIVIPNTNRGLTRFTSLLNMFKIDGRIVDNITNLKNALIKDIDWNVVNSELNERRKEASRFIISCLNRVC